jgi:hypothetical protein
MIVQGLAKPAPGRGLGPTLKVAFRTRFQIERKSCGVIDARAAREGVRGFIS